MMYSLNSFSPRTKAYSKFYIQQQNPQWTLPQQVWGRSDEVNQLTSLSIRAFCKKEYQVRELAR